MSTRNNHKPQLHISMLNMMSRCGIQFQRRYGRRFGIWETEEIILPGVAARIGSSVHKSIQDNLTTKIKFDDLLPKEHVLDIVRDEFTALWNEGVMLSEEEAANTQETHDKAIDMSVALAGLHYDDLAPHLKPLAVEERFVIELKNFPIDLSGTKDIREENCIRDTKTMARKPSSDVIRSMQMAMYALSEKVERGKYPEKVVVDCLVKTKTPQLVILEECPDDRWTNPLLRRVERAVEIIDAVKAGKQAFAPADTTMWICTEKYCGYAHSCKFWSGR